MYKTNRGLRVKFTLLVTLNLMMQSEEYTNGAAQQFVLNKILQWDFIPPVGMSLALEGSSCDVKVQHVTYHEADCRFRVTCAPTDNTTDKGRIEFLYRIYQNKIWKPSQPKPAWVE